MDDDHTDDENEDENDDRCQVLKIPHLTLWIWWAKNIFQWTFITDKIMI